MRTHTGKKYEQVLAQFNDTTADFPHDKTLYDLFKLQAQQTPDNIAVIIHGGARVEAQVSPPPYLTYGQLLEQAHNMALLLKSKGAAAGAIVGIMIERSLEMMIGLFAVLEIGAAYLPIAPGLPAARRQYMLRDSGAAVLLTTRHSFNKDEGFENWDGEIVFIDDCSGDSPGVRWSPENIYSPETPADGLVYVIYTSGSTGKPKGVMVEHRSVVNRLHWMQKKYPLTGNDTLLQKTPFFFDVSVWELFWWSFTGARLCLLPPGVEKFPQYIIDAVEKNRVTAIHFVPSMLGTFLEYLRGKEDEISRIAGLKRVFVSGEAFTPAHLKAFNEILYKTNSTEITNLYGPTEATVDVTYFDCPPGENLERIPIGKPIDNIILYVLDEDLRRQPIEEKGELCISGVGLARGYLNNPQLTAEKFVAFGESEPFCKKVPTPPKTFNKSFCGGCRGVVFSKRTPLLHKNNYIYKTGDMARWLVDGNIEFLGRMDYQVKIRGLRIELGEIEQVLASHDAVRDCVAAVKKYSENIVIIAAYIIKKAEVSPQDLKNYLKKSLPDYMIPNTFIFMDSFPTTPAGKLDRQALPEPQF